MKRLGTIVIIIFMVASLPLSAQLKVGDQPTNMQKSVSIDAQGSGGLQGLWLPRVTDTSITGIRSLNPPDGLVVYHTPSGKLLLRSNNAWTTYATGAIDRVIVGAQNLNGPILTFKTDSVGTNFDIAIAGNTLTWNLPSASETKRGAVTTGTQTFGGLKTLNNGVVVNAGSTLNNGTTTNNGLNVTGTGATTATSNLTLGLNSATVPAAATDRYLSVNAAGNVTLNGLDAIGSVTAGGVTATGPALTYNTTTAGTDFTISTVGNTLSWNLPSASTTARGAVTTDAQTFAGLKTFNNGVNVTGATGNVSNLTLGITDASPTTMSSEFLSVDAAGRVIFATSNMEANKPSRMFNYTLTLGSANIAANSTYRVTVALPVIPIPIVMPCSVYFSPDNALPNGVTIDWATIVGNNFVANISTRGAGVNLTGDQFYVTIIDF
ncbi:MAG: hypothetical protein JWQ96_2482 [Segetibacter sp.]|nr:hypothetical protein [Segetibacter sp.]